ncbi:MAG: hypothetical protein ACRDLO_10375 [Solirubrobacterales bacterium]
MSEASASAGRKPIVIAAGAIAATAGAMLVVALLLTWWGYPPVLTDPPSDLPGDLDLLSESLQEQAQVEGEPGALRVGADAFGLYDVRDIVWLITGIAGFALGLSALAGSRLTAVLAPVTAGLALVSIVLIAQALISPPDYLEIQNEFFGEAGGRRPFEIDYDVPFGRELGGWVALVGAIGVGAGAVLALRSERR